MRTGFKFGQIADQITATQNAREYAYQTLSGMSKNEIAAIMGKVYSGLLEYDKEQLSCPVLITYGDADRTGKVKQYSDRWAREETRPLRVIPNAAHNANMDNPTAFNQILADFLVSLKKKTN